MNARWTRASWGLVLTGLLVAGLVDDARAQTKPEGEMRWALYVTLSPVWFDPGEVVGQLTPFWVLYALHDALVKSMPGNQMTPSLAESWTVSADQLAYEFKLREGLKFHNGDPFTAEDVKFQLRAREGLEGAPRSGEGSGRGEPVPRAFPAPRALPRLHGLLRHHGDRRRVDRAQEVCRDRG